MPERKPRYSGRGMIPIFVVVGFSCFAMVRFSIPATKMVPKSKSISMAISMAMMPTITNDTTLSEEPTTTAQTQHTNERKRPLKFFAIHIGPSKTGTSAIQKDIAGNPFGVNTLGEDKDNVIYVGKRSGYGWPDPNANEEIRKIHNGTLSVTPKEEHKFYSNAIKCMEVLLEKHYNSSHSGGDRAITNKLLENDEATRASLRQDFIDECWTYPSSSRSSSSSTTSINIRYMLDSSIVESEETNSYKNKDRRTLGTRFRIFDILGYDRLIVVGAYRRYADWFVSGYTQSIQNNCMRPSLEGLRKTIPCHGFEDFLKRNLKKGYRLRGGYYNIDETIPEILDSGPSKTEAKILNYFQLPKTTSANANANANISGVKTFNSITTELYCDAFGKELTPHTCRHARDIAATASKNYNTTTSTSTSTSLVINKGGRSNDIYHEIVAAAFRLGFLIPTDQELREQTKRKQWCLAKPDVSWCDCIQECVESKFDCDKEAYARHQELDSITSNGENTIVGTNSSKITTYKDLAQYHHARVYTTTTTTTTTRTTTSSWTKSLPMNCPLTGQLNTLLQRSLKFEALVMPEFYATPLGRKEHERMFWDIWLGEEKLFCWVDTEALFRNATSWNEIVNERMVDHVWTDTDAAPSVLAARKENKPSSQVPTVYPPITRRWKQRTQHRN